MAKPKAAAGPVPGPPPGPPRPLPENPILGTSNKQPAVTGNSQTNIGVLGQSLGSAAGPATDGVFGLGQNGVHGQTYSAGGSGVLGEYTAPGSGDGVLGTGPNGVHGKSAVPGGSGVVGEHSGSGAGLTGTSATGIGVSGTSHGASPGVYGYSDGNAGVVGKSSNFNGGWFESAQAEGVRGVSHNANHGAVVGVCTQANGIGVFGYCDDGTGTLVGTGVYGKSNQSGEAGHFDGNVTINGTLTHNGNCSVSGILTVVGDVFLPGADCAEQFDLLGNQSLEPGTVVVIDSGGALRESQQAYDKKVAGVVSGAGEFRPGIVLDRRSARNDRVAVALVGKVYCKVDAKFSPIDVGDLLTTSPTPGHAMRASDSRQTPGAVIGKALRPLSRGQGLIPILVALQ